MKALLNYIQHYERRLNFRHTKIKLSMSTSDTEYAAGLIDNATKNYTSCGLYNKQYK
jgi:hypothetical protein